MHAALRAAAALALTALLAFPASALPTPGMNGPTWEPAYGRLFPEALETNDYISYEEALASLAVLDERHPDMMEIVDLGESVGWLSTVSGEREPTRIFSVEVTNEKSVVPAAQKRNIVFLLSVHANEKGAREGGLRIIEDLLIGEGIAERQPELVDLLDWQRLVFVFANSDGWTHEELEYRANDACYLSVTCLAGVTAAGGPGAETQNFVRVNGNGIDLNRQYPTTGYLSDGASYRTMEQPEARAMVDYLKGIGTVAAAADVHGMLNNDNFFRILLKDGEKTQRDFAEHERLAENLKQRLNSNPHYQLYQDGAKVPGAWGGDFAEWAATFDAIGYSASGTGGAFVTQHLGLGAPGFTIEQAYSHITVDNYYPGAGALLNDYHVESMRDTVAVFMEFVRDEARVHVEGHGLRVGYLPTEFVATSADDDKSAYEGWFVETDVDDAYDILHHDFFATPNEWFASVGGQLQNGRVESFDTVDEMAARASEYDAIVIPGSAAKRVANDSAALAALKAYAEAGGNLVLTDEALSLLPKLGLVADGAVGMRPAYSGYTDLLTRDHYLVKDVKGAPRVTYDANPLGFAAGECPVWYVESGAFAAAGGDAVGEIVVEAPRNPLAPPALHEHEIDHAHGDGPTEPLAADSHGVKGVNLGALKLGAGKVHVFGAVLPDATEANAHPYGLDGYAVSVTGNRVLLNTLGFELVSAVEPLDFEGLLAGDADALGETKGSPSRIPAAGLAAALGAALSAAAVLARRRK